MRWLRFLFPLVLAAFVDLLFRWGLWEPWVQPHSHAGTSVRTKHMVQSMREPVDYVTLGSSRPHYGLRHQLLDELAKRHGARHISLTMPGSHWMTVAILGDWLQRNVPGVRGGIVALSIHDFAYAFNGDYEIGITAPFQYPGSQKVMMEHIQPTLARLSSWGSVSSLFAYREDIRQALIHPIQRHDILTWISTQPAREPAGNVDHAGNLCHLDIQSLADCAAVTSADEPMTAQCRQVERMVTSSRPDYSSYPTLDTLSETAERTRSLIRQRLRELPWKQPIPLILMPMHRVWESDILPLGQRQWVKHILAPLQEDGSIVVLDYTDFFENKTGTDCSAFFDLYHNNTSGSERLTEALVPEIAHWLHPH